jgi:hypothetical protein
VLVPNWVWKFEIPVQAKGSTPNAACTTLPREIGWVGPFRFRARVYQQTTSTIIHWETCHDSVVDASQLELRLGFTLVTYLGNRNWTNHLGQLGIELDINENVFLVDRPSIPHGAPSIVGSIRPMIRVASHSWISLIRCCDYIGIHCDDQTLFYNVVTILCQ